MSVKYKRVIIKISGEALGHNWEIKTEEATCENSGYSFELCTRCWMENNRNEIIETIIMFFLFFIKSLPLQKSKRVATTLFD